MTATSMLRGNELLAWIAARQDDEREHAVDDLLGVAEPVPPSTPPGDHLIGYHASGIEPILQIVAEVPITERDVVVDLGAGLGKVVLLVHLLTGAKARGIELQPDLVERAREAAARCAADVRFDHGDARTAHIEDGNVFFLYLPFTGPVLLEVLERLRAVALRRKIVVCTLGLDLDRHAPWLVRRGIESFWLAIYDSA